MRMHQNPFDYLDEEGVIESPGIEPILINLKRVDEKKENEVIEMNLISQNRFNNIRVFTSFSRLEDQHENIENIGNNSERNKCLKEENIEKKKETMSALRRIQCFIRKTLFKVKKNICESQNFEVKVSIIRKIGDLYIWLKLIYHKIKNNYFLHAIFYELSERKLNGSRRKKKIEVFKIDIPKELSLKILDSPKPFVWVNN